MMPRKKRKMLIILSIVICLIVIIAILVVLYIKTDMFKSNRTLFKKYLGQNFENIDELYKNVTTNEYEKKLKENKYTSETELKVNFVQNIGTTLESTENPLNELELEINGQTDSINEYNHQDVKLIKDNEKISEIKCVQKENLIGIEFSDSFEQYVLAENENLKKLFEQAGFSEQQLSKIPDKIEFNNDFNDLITFSKEEKENIKQKYLNILFRNIDNSNFSKASNKTIQIDGKNINANGYEISLTKEKLNDIYIKLLEEIKQDEIILSKIDKIKETLEQYKIIFGEIKDLRNEFVTEIEYLIKDITQNNIGQDECKIIVYEKNGKTLKTVIQGVEYEINLDLLDGYVEISYKSTQEEIKEKSFILKKENNITNIIYKETEGEKILEYSFEIEEEISGNNCNRNCIAKYEDDTNTVQCNIKSNIQIVENFENELVFNNENSVNLNELQTEQVKAIIDRIKTAVIEKTNEIQENVITIQNLKEALIAAKLMQEEETIIGTGITETEKNRFNSKFEMLEGENLNNEAVLNLLNAIKDNLIELQPVSSMELKLKLDQFNNNEEAFTKINTFIQNNKSKKYNVKIEYNEETGLVDGMLLVIVEKTK